MIIDNDSEKTEEKLSSVIGGCYSGAVVTVIQHQSHLVLDVVTSLGIESSWAFTASLNDNYCYQDSLGDGQTSDLGLAVASPSAVTCCSALKCSCLVT